MRELGNALTILGIVVTLVAYFGQHSRVTLADLEPRLARGWFRGRAWVLRKLGRSKAITIRGGLAGEVSFAGSAIGMVWSPIQPGDDIAVRADKLERNLAALRTNLQQTREHDQKRLRELADTLTERVTALDQLVATRHQETVKATTTAMRWEVRGLLITFLGAALGILG
jgi:hypothetical protein